VSTLSDVPSSKDLPPGITRRKDGRLLAQVFVRRGRGRKGKVFGPRAVAAAKAWKRETEVALSRGEITAGAVPTLRKASEVFLAGIEDGTIRTRSRTPYKPSTIARYRRALDTHLLDELGSFKMNEVTSGRLERLKGTLQAKPLAANSVRNAMMPLLAIYRWAVRHDLVAVDPTRDLELPLDNGRRDRFATPAEVELLIAALADRDRPLWATAFYAGLRRGELMALVWDDVDLAAGIVRVLRNHDPESKTTGDPKSFAGKRRVPIPPVLREHLVAHKMRASTQPLVFSRFTLAGRRRGVDGPFSDSGVSQRARKCWEEAGLQPITLHECRHTFASLMIAAMADAGKFNPKRLQQIMGHSSITTTYDRYGHLMPGDEEESAAQLQAFLDSKTATESATESATEETVSGLAEPSMGLS
jgi:integrase